MMRSAFALCLLASALVGCSDKQGGSASASASGSPPAAKDAEPSAESVARIATLLEAEHRRAAVVVEDTDLNARDPALRRAAARTLARIGGKAARPKLARLLYDDDAEVTRWAAYGLGSDCAEVRDATVDALVARAIALPDSETFDPAFTAIARAIAACASPAKSEATLTAWLGAKPTRRVAAALALGDLARSTKRLLEETWVSLFARAAGGVSDGPLPEALYAVSRVENVPPSVVDRLAEVATARLAEPGPYRLFAIRALGRAKAHGLDALERILFADAATFTMPERVEALRAAGRLGADGQVLIGKVLEAAAAQGSAALSTPESTQVLLAALAEMKDAKAAAKAIVALASLVPANAADARTRRITSLVRCGAARIRADIAPTDPLVTGCDLDKSWIGKRTGAEVLGRNELRGPSLVAFRALLSDPDARVREAALERLGAHPELDDTATIVAEALSAKEPGVVTTVAEQIRKRPQIASEKPPAKKKKKKDDKDKDKPEEEEPLLPPSKKVEAALLGALDRADKEHDFEMLGALVEAVGALGQKSLLPRIQTYCASPYPIARERATNAIALLSGGRRPVCEAPERSEEVVPELASGPAAGSTIVFETDAGELTITFDPTLAPIATRRFIALAKQGYYDGNVLHRVDPSFVVQFGSPFADGAGGPTDLPPLRCETSPAPFEPLTVGVALSGRDTGSSQLFVMRSRQPHLDGGYALVGRASGPWDAVIEGDTIVRAKVKE